MRHVEALLGVEMAPGGRHEGFGTHNRLLGFGGRSYMEVVAIDPGQTVPERPRWFGLDSLAALRLVTWCAPATDLPSLVARGAAAGIDLGARREGSRARPDGSVLRWTMTDPWADRAGGVVPFFIDWGESPHPAESLPAACRFLDLRVEHPEPDRVRGWLQALGLDTPVSGAQAPAVIASLETPNGVVELR